MQLQSQVYDSSSPGAVSSSPVAGEGLLVVRWLVSPRSDHTQGVMEVYIVWEHKGHPTHEAHTKLAQRQDHYDTN